ncbi:MAG: LppX_LprAFG lipoprotein [Anaerolineae bacterium]|nr:LppX_LprAFG lipoprotein [Anaerolineae bacterium]
MADTQMNTERNSGGQSPLRWLLPLIVVIAVVAIAAVALLNTNTPGDDTPPPEPTPLLAQVVENIRNVETFRLLIEQTGVAYPFGVSLDEGQSVVYATMRRGEGQYQAPNMMYASVNLKIGALPVLAVELFAEGLDQWFKLANQWINYPIAEGFDPGDLIAEDTGFSQAINQLREVAYIGTETLIDGTQSWHISGVAEGQVINDLLFNLLSIEQEVMVDVYIDQATTLPALLVVTLPDTASDSEDNTAWHIEIYDYNTELDFTPPNRSADAGE